MSGYDGANRNSPSKGHGINGMRKTLFRPASYRFKNTCACTRTYRCPKHGGVTP